MLGTAGFPSAINIYLTTKCFGIIQISCGILILTGSAKEDGKMHIEHRQKVRDLISVPVSFPNPAEISAKNMKVLKGTTADFSTSGLGIFSDIKLNPDTVLEIECRDIRDTPKKFSVKW